MSSDPLSVALLAGGLATRLRPMTESIPKALVEILGEPFVAHQLRLLRQKGLQQVVLCVGHLGDQIAEVVGSGKYSGLQISYSFDGPRLLGTAGAVKNAIPLLSDPFYVMYGDSYLDCDYRAIAAYFLQTGKTGLMTVFKNEGRWDKSNVEFHNNQVVDYNKSRTTKAMQHIDYGLGVFRKAAFDPVQEKQSCDLQMVYRELLRNDQLAATEVFQRFYEVGSPEGIEELEMFLAGTLER